MFGQLPANSTTAEISLSALMQKAWADFAKNPQVGPGWNKLNVNAGVNDIGVFNVHGMSVSANVFDKRCAVFRDYLEAL